MRFWSRVGSGGIRWVAVTLAAMVLVFCLSAAVPATPADDECQGPATSSRICGPSGASEPLPVVMREAPAVWPGPGPAASPVAARAASPAHRAEPGPAAPRAPPRVLA